MGFPASQKIDYWKDCERRSYCCLHTGKLRKLRQRMGAPEKISRIARAFSRTRSREQRHGFHPGAASQRTRRPSVSCQRKSCSEVGVCPKAIRQPIATRALSVHEVFHGRPLTSGCRETLRSDSALSGRLVRRRRSGVTGRDHAPAEPCAEGQATRENLDRRASLGGTGSMREPLSCSGPRERDTAQST